MDLSWEMITCVCVWGGGGGGAFGCVHSKNGSVLFHTESMLPVKTHGVDMPRGTYFQYEIYTSIFAVCGPRSLMVLSMSCWDCSYLHYQSQLCPL